MLKERTLIQQKFNNKGIFMIEVFIQSLIDNDVFIYGLLMVVGGYGIIISSSIQDANKDKNLCFIS